jgi:DNA polymerase-1
LSDTPVTTNTSADDDLEDTLAFLGLSGPSEPTPAAAPPAPAPVAAVGETDDLPGDPLPGPSQDAESLEQRAAALYERVNGHPPPPEEVAAAHAGTPLPEDDGDSPDDFMFNAGIQPERQVPNPTMPWMKHHNFVLVKSIEQVNEIVDEAIRVGRCALDLETQGLDTRIFYDAKGKPRTVHQIVGFCIAVGDAKTGYYIPVRHNPIDDGPAGNLPVTQVEEAISRLCWAAQPTPGPDQTDPLSFRVFEKPPQVVIDFWNAKFDQEMLYPVTGIDWWHPESFEDGLLASFVIYSADKALGLKFKSMELLRDPEGNAYEMIKLKDLFTQGRRIQFDTLAPDEEGVKKYACSDAICTRRLCDIPDIIPKVKKRKDLSGTYRIEKQVIQVVRTMERNRVKIDVECFRRLLVVHIEKRDELHKRIIDFAVSKGFHGFEPGSPKQLSDFLFSGERGLNITVTESLDWPKGKPPINEKSGQYKTDAKTLEALVEEMGDNAPPVLQWIVNWREEDKVIGTYLEKLTTNFDPDSHEMRFQFKETGAATGRFSAPQGDAEQGFAAVPIHGIPGASALRNGFIARPGYTMVKSDYAGEELRIATNVSGEPVWIKEFLEGEGDLHTITARAFFGVDKPTKEQRKAGKIANFALLYGGGPAAIMRAIPGCTREEAARKKQLFDKAVPEFAKWIKKQHATVKEKKGVYTAFGRWIAIPDIDSPENAIKAACERHAVNYAIQGSGADIMKIVMILLHKEFYKRGWLKQGGDDTVRMLLTVHDEIVFEIRNDRVPVVLPVLVRIMEAPTSMPSPPLSPKWRVPLIVEPLLGQSWGGQYNWDMLTRGKKGKLSDLKDNEKDFHVQVGDKLYHKVPPWLEGILKPGWETDPEVAGMQPQTAPVNAGGAAPTPSSAAPAPISAPSAPVQASAPIVMTPAKPNVWDAPRAPAKAPVPAAGRKPFTIRLNNVSRQTVKIVQGVCCGIARDVDRGSPLRLIDPFGNILIDPSFGVLVDPETFARELRNLALSDGVAIDAE